MHIESIITHQEQNYYYTNTYSYYQSFIIFLFLKFFFYVFARIQ